MCKTLYLATLITVVTLFGQTVQAVEAESTQHYKMFSTIEYTGKGQFSSQAETLFNVTRQPLSADKVQYTISTNDLGQGLDSELSFVVDKKTGYLSGVSRDVVLSQHLNNLCINRLTKITQADVGETWKQSFDMSSVGGFGTDELDFTVSAIQPETTLHGKMMMVRAVSKDFNVEIVSQEQTEKGNLRCKISSAYLFDEQMEDIFMSVSVFEASTNVNGFKEQLRHEVATYKSDATGLSADLTGLDKKFERFIRKVGLHREALKIKEETSLPRWAQSEGAAAAQAANVCAALACEGSLNPVATVYIPTARIISLQSAGRLAGVGQAGTVSGALAQNVPGVATLKIAVAPAVFMGMSMTTVGAVTGGTLGTVAIASGGSGGSSSRSPSSP